MASKVAAILTPETVAALVAAGQTDLDDTDNAALDDLRGVEAVNRLHWRDWDAVTDLMPTPDMVALLKALVVAEQRFGWSGGSVAAAIWVYRALEQRVPEEAYAVANWILPRRTNPYVPFGSAYYGPPTYNGFKAEQERHRTRRIRHAEEEQTRQASAAARNAARGEAGVVRTASGQADAADRRAEIDAFALLSPLHQLCHIANNAERPVDYYPFNNAWESDALLEAVDGTTRTELLRRLTGRRKGPWRRLYERLQVREETGVVQT